MNLQRLFTAITVASGLTFSVLSAGNADVIETTTTQTTTTEAGGSTVVVSPTTRTAATVVLSPTTMYQVIDPITGSLVGTTLVGSSLLGGSRLSRGVVIVDKSSGNLVATVDANGNIVDIGSVPATETLVVSINARRADLRNRIEESLKQGRLDAAQAAAIRAQLERIAADESINSQSPGVLTYRRALMTGYGLNLLSDRLIPQTVAFQPIVSPQFVTVNGNLILVDSVTARKNRLTARIDDEYSAGRLSSNQVTRRKQDLSKISISETKYRRNGELSNSNEAKLFAKLDQLKIAIDENVASINEKRSRIGIRVD